MKNLSAIMLFILLINLSGCDIISSLISMNKMSKGSLETTDFFQEIPFSYTNSHIIIEAEIAGQKGEFYFDTGAGNILFKNRIATNSFKKIGNLASKDASGQKMEMPILSIPKLAIGQVQFSDLSFRLIEEFDFQCSDNIVGIIGYSTLRHANWQIDYAKQIIRFSDQLGRLDTVGQKVDLYVNKFTSEPQVPVKVNDSTHVRFTFDTGNSGGLLADQETFENIAFENKFVFNGGKAGGLASSNEKTFRDSTVYKLSNSLKIGAIPLNPSIVDYKYAKSLNLLGNKVLENYLITISWSEKAAWLKAVKTPEINLAGFQFHIFEDEWIVTAVEQNFQKESGLEMGDQIIAIDGQNIREHAISICDQNTKSSVFTIQKQNEDKQIKLQNINLLLN